MSQISRLCLAELEGCPSSEVPGNLPVDLAGRLALDEEGGEEELERQDGRRKRKGKMNVRHLSIKKKSKFILKMREDTKQRGK